MNKLHEAQRRDTFGTAHFFVFRCLVKVLFHAFQTKVTNYTKKIEENKLVKIYAAAIMSFTTFTLRTKMIRCCFSHANWLNV